MNYKPVMILMAKDMKKCVANYHVVLELDMSAEKKINFSNKYIALIKPVAGLVDGMMER